MKKFEVWSEGYVSTGLSCKADYHGKFEGEDFRDAVTNFRNSLTDKHSRDCINLDSLTIWGCYFFDNELDARKSFG
jgi:hypothetical protein